MRPYSFRVVPINPDDTSGVPIAVAGQTMVDIQKLITDIGCMLVRLSMRIQNHIPAKIKKKFDLTIGGGSGPGLDTGPSEGNDAALEGAIALLCSTLDFLGKGAVGTWMSDTFEDEESRTIIAKDLVDLTDHLKGYALEYGTNDSPRRFEELDRKKIVEYTVRKEWVSGAVGVVVRDTVKKNRWHLNNDGRLIPLSFDKNIVTSDIPTFAAAGPVILIGKVERDAEEDIIRIEKVSGCYTIPELKFSSIITKDGDRRLLNPLIAKTGFDAERQTWTMRNDTLGIAINKPSWDECVVSFHEYAQFLFETYVDANGPFEGEEKDIHDFLVSLLPA